MQSMLRHRPSAATVLAFIALFVSLGSGAFAVSTKLKKNSVTTKTIKNSAVTNAKLANGAVTDSKLANGAVTDSKLANGAVSESKIANGAVTASKLPPLTFQSAGAGSVQFAKDAFGIVHLKGSVTSISIGSAMFTLPAGFRPTAAADFATVCGFSTLGEAEVATNGNVTPFGGSCNTLLMSLDGVSFPTS
jgi:hypothetical protein